VDQSTAEALNFGLMLKHLYWGLVVGTVLVTGSGCSGNNGDDDDDSAGNSDAAGKCATFFEVYCPRMVDCLVEGGTLTAGDRDEAADSCLSNAKASVDCSRAVGVTSSYDSCITALQKLDCAAVNTAIATNDTDHVLPEVCKGVLLIGI
jgi:hypothetical protein